jgi:hypothetical protein
VADDANVSRDDVLFIQVISMFQVAAMQQMGKIPNPMTNEIEKDLDQAKMSVDILAMLKKKTAGNLSKREDEYLGKIVFECQMNYLDELKSSGGDAPAEDGGAPDTEGSDGADDGGKAEA